MDSIDNQQAVPGMTETARRLTGDTAVNADTAVSPIESHDDDSPQSVTDQIYSEKKQDSVRETKTSESAHRKAFNSFVQLLQNGKSWLTFQGGSGKSRARSKLELPPPIVRSLNNPKRGYSNLATFLDSSEAFMQYRKFGYLQSRVLLDRQDELRRLEEELEVFDKSNPKQCFTRDGSADELKPRKKLFGRIEHALGSYSKLLISAQQMMSFHQPSDSEYRSVCTYIHNNKPIHRYESAFIKHRGDIVTLRPGREHAWLDRTIETALKKLDRPFLRRIFSDEMTRRKSEGRKYEIYYCRERINFLANICIIMMILALLIVPTYLLYHQVTASGDVLGNHAMAVCIGILLVFTLAFSAVLSFFTRAKRHEILGAAAAYCAVLVVFFGNINPA